MDSKAVRKMLALLRKAREAIANELQSAGWDEVAQHPGLRSKSRLLNQIDEFLKVAKG
jgi:pyruvate formate-lyase activating enzyme-like uncharacterized protein